MERVISVHRESASGAPYPIDGMDATQGHIVVVSATFRRGRPAEKIYRFPAMTKLATVEETLAKRGIDTQVIADHIRARR